MSNNEPCHPSRCPSCRVPFVDHLGLIGTCAELMKTRQESVKLREALVGLIGYASSVDVDNVPWVNGLALRINLAMEAIGVEERYVVIGGTLTVLREAESARWRAWEETRAKAAMVKVAK